MNRTLMLLRLVAIWGMLPACNGSGTGGSSSGATSSSSGSSTSTGGPSSGSSGTSTWPSSTSTAAVSSTSSTAASSSATSTQVSSSSAASTGTSSSVGSSSGTVGGCGDGNMGVGEACDDGNTAARDGCSAGCQVEAGWTCSGTPSACTALCGDGMVVGAEQCEDGNAAAGDGCSPACVFEASCGNGTVEPGEVCDDGNTSPGDGCSIACTLEPGSTCGDSTDLNDTNNVAVSGSVTTYSGTTAGSADTVFGAPPGCSGGTLGVPRVVHRYRTGARPAVLHVATADVGGALVDTAVWAYLNCQTATPQLACGDDVLGLLGALDTGWLPAGTTVFIVVAGYSSVEVGPYRLVVTETPATAGASSGTCAAATAAGPGTWAGVTAAAGEHSGSVSTLCLSGAPDTVYSVELSGTSDLRAWATTNVGTLDLTLSLLGSGCGAGPEVVCADASGAGNAESLEAKDLAAGTYYVVVGGFSTADLGPHALNLDVVEVLATGAPCDPAQPGQCCRTGDACHAGTCQTPTDLLFADFNAGLSPFAATDYLADGNTWKHCDPAVDCAFDNTTGLHPSDPCAMVSDAPGVSLHGEVLTSPALNAAAVTTVMVELDQAFDHVAGCADLGVMEVSADGSSWATVANYTTDQQGHTVVDISSAAAGQGAVQLRFRYDDQTNLAADPFANGWRLDNVRAYGF